MGENIVKSISNNQNGNIMDSFIELFGELLKSSKIDYNGILKILKNEYELAGIVARLTKTFNTILQYNDFIANKLISMDKRLLSNSTKQEITEILNKVISSHSEKYKQTIEEIIKRIGEANKQTIEKSNLYHTQTIQMFKDLIENINKLNNKVDRLESVSQKKEMTEKATQSAVQKFTNGLHTSKNIYINNILKEDLECDKEDILINNKHNTVGEEPIIINNKKDKITPQCSQVDNTVLEDVDKKDTCEENKLNQQQPLTRQIVIDGSSIDKARVLNEENKNIDKPKVNESHEKLDLKTIMKISRETTIIKYKEKVGNDYTKERFKNNTEIGIGCKHRAFLRFDGKMTKLNGDVFEKDTELEKDTYYIEREGQKYLVFRNIDSVNADVPNDSFTLMKLPEGCQKIDNNIVVDILNKARIEGIDGENSILIDSIEELQGLVVADEMIRNKYFNEAKNRRVCSLLSNGGLMNTYTSEFEKGCKDSNIADYMNYMPCNDEQLEFRSKKEIDNDIYIKPYVKIVENLPVNSSEENEKLKEKLKMYNSSNKNFIISEQKLVF